MKYFQISVDEFKNEHGDFELISVRDKLCIVQSEVALNAPFTELQILPAELRAELDEKLEMAKKSKIEAINFKRDEAIAAGVLYKEHIFQSAKDDRDLLTSTATIFSKLGATPEDFVWISKDNVLVPFSLDDIFALGAIMAQSVNENTLKARKLKDKVLAAQSVKEVELVEWDEKV